MIYSVSKDKKLVPLTSSLPNVIRQYVKDSNKLSGYEAWTPGQCQYDGYVTLFFNTTGTPNLFSITVQDNSGGTVTYYSGEYAANARWSIDIPVQKGYTISTGAGLADCKARWYKDRDYDI